MSTTDDVLIKKAGKSSGEVINNILSYWEAATERNREDGAQWYLINQQAIDEMAHGSGVSLDTAAAVVAHLSPRIHWSRNIIAAHSVLNGLPVTGIMTRSLAGARAAIAAYQMGEDPLKTLKGPKIRNFAANLIGDSDAVTIDIWAGRVALDSTADLELIMARAGVYAALAQCYREAAARVDVTPSTMQATVWIVARNGRAD